ncbi:hypothetical protein QJQ45_027539, partial [Haematococcus lacustris]
SAGPTQLPLHLATPAMGVANKYAASDATAGFFNKYSFRWINPIVSAARKDEVPVEACVLPPEQTADTLALPIDPAHAAICTQVAYERFRTAWDEAVAKGNPKLRKVLQSVFGRQLMLAGLFKLLWSVCVIMGAFFFVRTLQFHVNRHPEWREPYQGWILAAAFFMDGYVLGIALQRMTYGCMTVGVSVRAALTNAICRKSFAMASITKEMASDAVSFVASDITKIFDGIQARRGARRGHGGVDIHYLWTAPIEALAILTILVVLVKQWALPGWGVVFIVMPCQYLFGWRIILHKKANAANTQERGSIFQELLPAMKLVKYYAWEQFFEKTVSTIRKRELAIQSRVAFIKTIQIIAYELNVSRITSTLTFPILSLFNILRFPLVVLPKAMRAASDMLASIDRVEAFLLAEVPDRQAMNRTAGVAIRDAEFKHPNSTTPFTLSVPEFSVKAGELVAVVGRVGAGKSSLISAIQGNMEKLHGSATCGGRVAYVPQNPWCQNLTLRDSILFGKEFDPEAYDAVIHACALELDLQILPQGDQSYAGLRGINLSGGQRQRLNVARAAYADSDLVLLDNALSAVDHHTAHHMFSHCLRGLMRDKAVVMITHQVEFLPQMDKVAIMEDGRMLYFGPWNERARELLSRVLPTSHLLAAAGGAEQPRDTTKKARPATSGSLNLGVTDLKGSMGKKKEKKTALTVNEAMRTMLAYSPGWGTVFTITLIIFLACQTSRQISDWWLRQWTSDARVWYPKSVIRRNPVDAATDPPFTKLSAGQAYIITYSIPVLFFVFSMYFRGEGFHWWTHGSCQRLHARAVHNTLYAPLSFFLQNPVGELLLAFTKDQDTMDEGLVDSLHYLGIYGLIMLSTIITVSTTIYYFSAFAGVLIIVTLIMLVFYLPAATKLKAHRTTTGGALVGLVAETLEGLSVIQAFNKTEFFIQTAIQRNDVHHATVFTGESLNLWLAHWCDLYGAILVLAVSCFAVGLAEELGAATVGLAFSNTIQMLVFYTWSVRFLAESLFNLAAVEKIGWLATSIPVEGAAKADQTPASSTSTSGGKPDLSIVVSAGGKQAKSGTMDADGAPINWPSRGTVVFDNVWMKYAPTAPFALKGVTFSLAHHDKVGVVGRTGSGKSTLLLALYRMFELEKGNIFVDGANIASMTLRRLRRGLSIIPQEPVVFSGTVRTNLDPFSEHTDVELWDVIKQASLEEQVKRTGGLDGRVAGTGSGAWSLGQQQLVCLSRAALRKVPVLCLDEATAAMDPATEQEVQAVIKRVFQARTITIAHRLDTVIESDKVLVMEAGVLKENAEPSALLADRESIAGPAQLPPHLATPAMGVANKYAASDATAGFFNKYSFRWINPIVSAARRDDVPVEACVLPPEQTADVAYERFRTAWDEAVAKGNPKLRKVLQSVFGRQLMLAGLFKLLWSVCVIMGAFFFVRTLQFHVNRHPEWREPYQGWILAAAFFMDGYVLGIALQRMTYGCMTVGVSVRAALTNAICRKSFAMASITKEMASDAVSFVASDITKIFDGIQARRGARRGRGCAVWRPGWGLAAHQDAPHPPAPLALQDIHYLWTAPIEALAILTILVVLVKQWALPGWGVVFIVMPCQYLFGWRIILHKKANAANTQERGSIFQELLPAMKLVKYYAWEQFFEKTVSTIRKRELAIQFRVALIKTIQVMMVFGTPPATALVIFSAYELNVSRITSTLTFPILSLFNILRFPLVVLPKAMRAASDMLASIDRVEAFLLAEVPDRQAMNRTAGVAIRDAEFKHPNSTTPFTLSVPEFSVKAGELVAVVGRVGAGKSSLISAILGNMEKLHGSATYGGRVAYVPQNPWCQNLTLRDSILFGKEFDPEAYDAVIHACALELDLQILPQGDQSYAGLRGINLSGGQRQRLNVARAAYADSDLVLLDNALSAVDHHTAHHMFSHCLRGLMRDKAVVMITHQVEFLPQMDKVAIMEDGRMLYFGPWNERARELLSRVLPTSHLLAAAGGAEQPRDTTKKARPATSGSLNLGVTDLKGSMGKKKEKKTALTVNEAMRTMLAYSPGWGTVFTITLIIFLACQTSRQISDWWLRQWTSDARVWYPKSVIRRNPVDAATDPPFTKLSAGQAYIITYSIPVLFFVFSMFFRGAGFHWWTHGSCQRLHARAVHNTLYAPLSFFLQNPVGELLLAFTKDQDIMDENLVDSLHYLGIYGLIMLSTIITVSTTIYYFSAFAGVLIIVTLIMLVFYLPAATKLKAHRTTTGGALVGLVAETLEGLSVIQAFNKTEFFIQTAIQRNDVHHATVFTGESLNLWLAHWCDLYGAILVLAVSCFAVGLAEELGAATVGLAFSNTIQMLVFYTWSVRFLAESLFNLAAVEKIGWLGGWWPCSCLDSSPAHTLTSTGLPLPSAGPTPHPAAPGPLPHSQLPTLAGPARLPAAAATSIPVEGAAKADQTPASSTSGSDGKPDLSIVVSAGGKQAKSGTMDADGAPINWPSRGTVVFDNVWMKYAPTAPFALKGVTFSLAHHDKVGVVGRTGSGKSTLLLALYRMFELEKGNIFVDGANIASMTLRRLRRGLSIIPQEPVVFSGTVRTNLDPFSEHTDVELWDVIKQASLEEQVKRTGGLDGRVAGTGSGAWSLGQQQLVCLSRAALRKVPVLCLDEATAAMDPATEQEVQAVIKRVFQARTIITIAHRLDTVIESDKVLVMEAGVLKENAEPSALLADRESMFSKLVDKTGDAAAAALRQMAANFFAARQAAGHGR